MPSGFKVTPEQIEDLIVTETYTTAYDAYLRAETKGWATDLCVESMEKLTICIITLKNGFTLVGTSSCVDPANYDENAGRDAARKRALGQLWMLEGYLLQQRFNRDRFGPGDE